MTLLINLKKAEHRNNELLGLGQTSNPSRVEYIKNRCDKASTSFQRGSKRRTCVDPISQQPEEDQ